MPFPPTSLCIGSASVLCQVEILRSLTKGAKGVLDFQANVMLFNTECSVKIVLGCPRKGSRRAQIGPRDVAIVAGVNFRQC